MNIIFHKDFFNSDYSDDPAASPGRMEAIMNYIAENTQYNIIEPKTASENDIKLAHTDSHIENIRENDKLYNMALLSTGSAIKASELAYNNEIAFSVNRPPGHHAYKNMSWGYCSFCNIAIALLKLKNQGLIKSAFVLDFDAHTGDGTIDVLKDDKSIKILNPMADNSERYLKLIEVYTQELKDIDIIAVSAGFDTYEKDLGKKLKTFDYFLIGTMLKKLAKRMNHNRIFAVLEGGYYFPDLGKNVVSFCEGLSQKVI